MAQQCRLTRVEKRPHTVRAYSLLCRLYRLYRRRRSLQRPINSGDRYCNVPILSPPCRSVSNADRSKLLSLIPLLPQKPLYFVEELLVGSHF